MNRTEIKKIKGSWREVVDNCRATVGKGELGKDPSPLFKQNILISEHSPIRSISVVWQWPEIKSWIATHWARHKWECFIRTQRTDRTGVNRDELPQSAPVSFTGEANVQALIDTMRKRLCCMAAKETREYAEDFKTTLADTEPEIASVLVPNCVYRCGCPEPDGCPQWNMFVAWCKSTHLVHPGNVSIQERYQFYNEWFMLLGK